MGYINASVNGSATIAVEAGAAVTAPAMRAFSFDAAGQCVLSAAGAHAVGLALPDAAESLAVWDGFTLQIKDIGLALAGGAFAKGAELTVDAQGRLVAAATGNFIFAVALQKSSGAGAVVEVQIIKAGYK